VKIEAILFDLGKVIVDFNFETSVQALHSCCSISRDRFEQVLWDEAWIRRYEMGEISTGDFHAYLCESASLTMPLADFESAWSSAFLPDPLVSYELLSTLKRNYPLILVSNINEAHFEFIQSKYSALDYFDQLVLSYEVGSLKPDHKIFEHAIDIAGRPAEALFFTDDREENILAARKLGIHGHQFQGQANLLQALQDAGVQIGEFAQDLPVSKL
jgi:putative hydrolase of the HAD superfamily